MKINKKKIVGIVAGALIAAIYTALTFTSAFFGLAYGSIQFRISEALAIMPVFTPVAIPGLIIGCILSNLTSTLGPIDVIVGAVATALAATCSYLFRKVTVKGLPLLSFLMPVLFNGVIVGAEIVLLTMPEEVAFSVFLINGLEVAAGEAAVLAILGIPLYCFIRKSMPVLEKFL